MKKAQLTDILLDQNKDLVWVINTDYLLVYANKSYLSVVKMVTGKEQKLNESAFVEGVDEVYLEKWKTYYNRSLKGESLEFEEYYYDSESNETKYNQVTLEPLFGDNNEVFAVSCQTKDITHIVKQKSEADQMMNASLDVFCSIDEEGKFTHVSAAAEVLWGYEPEELVGLEYSKLILEEDVSKTNKVAAAILSGKNITTFENRYKKKDGGIAFNIWSARWDNEAKLMYCVARDGKEKIEQEEKILQSEQRFKTLVQDGSDLIGILDKEGNYTYVSPTSVGVLGIAPEEFIGRNALEFVHPDDLETVLACLRKIATENKVIVEPFRFQNYKNEWRWVESVLSNMLDNPAVNGIVINSRDITHKIEEKQKLKLLESVITNTNDAVLITEAEPFDEPGPRIIYVNEAFTKMTGYTSEEVIGKSPRILQGPKSNIEALAKLGAALRDWQPYNLTTINYKKNGEEFWINFSVTPVANESGWYTHWIAIERDVTEQKNKELENSLLAQISSNFNLENDYVKASSELCKTIGEFGSFDLVELWTVNLEKSHMQLIINYLSNPKDNKFFTVDATYLKLRKTEGLPGKVWANNKQLLWDAKDNFKDFIRKDEAKKIGLKAVLGIPLVSNNEVVGVLAIGTKNNEILLKKYTKVFDRLQQFIGAELSRKTLENDLNYLFDTLPHIVSVGDFTGKFLTINKAGCKLMGYSEEEILQQSFEKFIHPDDLEIAHKELGRLNEGQTTLTFEVRFITKSGSIVWLSWYCTPNLNEGLIYSTAKNITEEKNLRELNRQSRKLARIGSWEVDLINQSLYWTDEVHQLHETDPSSFVPDLETAINFYREDFREMVQTAISRSITRGEPFDFEAVLLTAKNNERWVRAIGNAEFVDGRCTRFFGSFQDIHERKEAEIAVQKSEARFRSIFEIASLGIIQVNPVDGQIIIANSYYETITGYSREELLKMTILDLTHPEDQKKDWELFSRAARGEHEYRNEKRYVKKNGSIVWVKIHLAFIRDEMGQPVRTVAICEDITERKEAEQRLNSLSDNLPGVVFQYYIYPDGTDALKSVTAGSSDVWGFTPNVVMENNQLVWDQIIEGGNIEEVKKSISHSMETKSKWTAQWKYVMPTGEIKTHVGYGSPSYLVDGTIVFNSLILDVTLEVKNKELLEKVSGLAKMGSWEVDLIENKHYWSVVTHAILETDPDRFVPYRESLLSFCREDFISVLSKEFTKCIQQGTSVDLEVVVVTTSKKEKWVRLMCSPEMKNDECQRLVGSIQDITNRKEAETRLQSISDSLPGVIFQYFIHPDGTDAIQSIQGNVMQLWGFTDEQVVEDVNIVWDQIKKGGHFDDVQSSIRKSIETKSKWTTRIKYVYPNGDIRTHIGHGAPTFLANGTILYNSIVLDITQEATNEELLKQASKIARLGSWELDLINQGDNMYWSPVIKEILELNDDYNPSVTKGIELLTEESKELVQIAISNLIKTGKEFNEEFLIKTGKGNERWIRASGKSERVAERCVKIFGSLLDIHQLKTANENLKKAFNEKNIILESIGDAFFAVDTEWTVTYWNKEAESLLGMKREDIVGKYLWDAYKDAIDTDFYRQYHISMNTGEVVYFEEYYPTLDMWFDVSVYPSLEGLSIYFKDVTAKKKSEQENKRLQTTLENSLNEIYIFDANTLLFSYVNKGALLNLGYSEKEIKTLTPYDLKPEFTVASFKQLITSLLNKEKDKIVFFTNHKRKDGSLYPVEVHLQLVAESDNKRFLAVVLDITERIKAEKSILQANERFEKVTEATKDVIWDWDIINNTFYRSEAIDDFFGKQASKSFTKNDFWKDSFHPDDKDIIQKSVEDAIADPLCTRWKQEYRLFNEDGALLYIIDQGVIIRNKAGKATRMVGAMTNITEQKHMELQLSELNQSLQQYTLELERSNEELEHFAFVASHDLQEPLRMVSSFMDLLKIKYGDKIDEKGHQYIHFATDGAKRMKQIILDLLEYSRASRPTEGKEEVNLNEVLYEFEQLRSKLISEKSAKIISKKLPTLNTYKAAITQILHCLIDNGLKYSKEDIPPIIEIEAMEREKEWEFSINDNGIGIEPQFFEKIFIIFQRLHNKDKYTGTGIGLSIAKRHVEFLGGQIWLESVPGEGSVFYFSIPKTK